MSLRSPEARKQLKLATRVSAIGIELALGTTLGYFGGHWLDGRFGTAPYLSFVGLALGLFVGFRSLYRIARKTDLEQL